MEQLFWKSEAVSLCNMVLQHVKKAHRYYVRAGIQENSPFMRYSTTLGGSAKKALQQRQLYQQFLSSYQE
jgi:hypothetical protein